MNNTTTSATVTYQLLASCMANGGARAKSIARFSTEALAIWWAKRQQWEPLGIGREWSRTLEVVRIADSGATVVRDVIFSRDVGPDLSDAELERLSVAAIAYALEN